VRPEWKFGPVLTIVGAMLPARFVVVGGGFEDEAVGCADKDWVAF